MKWTTQSSLYISLLMSEERLWIYKHAHGTVAGAFPWRLLTLGDSKFSVAQLVNPNCLFYLCVPVLSLSLSTVLLQKAYAQDITLALYLTYAEKIISMIWCRIRDFFCSVEGLTLETSATCVHQTSAGEKTCHINPCWSNPYSTYWPLRQKQEFFSRLQMSVSVWKTIF